MTSSIIIDIVQRARKKGINKGELARRAGLTQPALSRLLSGTNGARLDTVERLASAAGLRIAVLPDDDFAADLLSGSVIDFGAVPSELD